MKKTIILFGAVCITASMLAQAPQKMSYQSVIRGTSGNLVANQSVGMRVSVLQGSATGTEVFKEIFNPNPQTNANGLVTIEVGSGIALTGTFAGIDWSSGPYFIKTDIDPTGGTTYTISGTSELLSVPYALNAANGNWTKNGSNIYNANSGNVGIGTSSPGKPLTINAGTNDPISIISLSQHDWYVGPNTGPGSGFGIYDVTAASNRIKIDLNGYVGIGTSTPAYPLEVASVTSYPSGGLGCGLAGYWGIGLDAFYNTSGPNILQNTGCFGGGVSIGCSGWFYTSGGGFAAASDRRIKNILGSTDSGKDLVTLSQLRITDYKYIDEINKGNVVQKKVIAQEVQAVYPNAVSQNEGFIPNVYEVPEIINSTAETTIIKTRKMHEFKTGDIVRLILETLGEKEVAVTVVDANTFSVNENITDRVFVYGKKINDLLSVDYDALSMLNISATQELMKKVELLEKENAELKSRLNSELSQFRSEIQALKASYTLQVQK